MTSWYQSAGLLYCAHKPTPRLPMPSITLMENVCHLMQGCYRDNGLSWVEDRAALRVAGPWSELENRRRYVPGEELGIETWRRGKTLILN